MSFVIFPYKSEGVWMFDDERVGLHREPLVRGTDTLIERATELAKIMEPQKGFRLTFGTKAFEGYQYQLDWKKAEDEGNVYHCLELGMDGWLCPALYRYFDQPPSRLYAAVAQ